MEEDQKSASDVDMMDEGEPAEELPFGVDDLEDSDVVILNDVAIKDAQANSEMTLPPNNETLSNHIKPPDLPNLADIEPVPAHLVAAERKRLGNEYFAKSDYKQALAMYSAAIEIMPTEAAYFGNRSACLLMMYKYKDAADDARKALNLDPNLKNGYVRLVRATLALGDVKSCQTALAAAANKPELNINFNDETRKLAALIQHKKDIESSQVKKDYRKTLYLTERAKEIAVGDSSLKILKAECMIKLGRFTEAQEQCTEILQSEGPPVMEACILRAYCFYQADNLDKSLHCYKQALMLAPDNQTAATYHKKIKQIRDLRELGAAKFKAQKWDESQDAYKRCLQIVESGDQGNTVLESKLNFNLALVTNKQDTNTSLTYVDKAIKLNPSYVKAILHRASISMKQEKYDEALKDLENAEKLEPQTKDIRRMIDNARILAKRAKRKDYYKILGIDKQASADEIKKAYKKRALVHHPDRHANASETERKDQERKFKEVLEAYEILLDDKKRRRYDSGLDVNDMSSANYETFDASQLFGNMFFTQGNYPNGFQQFQSRQGGFSGFRR